MPSSTLTLGERAIQKAIYITGENKLVELGHSIYAASYLSPQEAEDIYDVIEWLVTQDWCTGSVAMAYVHMFSWDKSSQLILDRGNSWLSISQINFASRLFHPALKAIAPWEGYTDLYRDFVGRGGKPHIPGFHRMISDGFAGRFYNHL